MTRSFRLWAPSAASVALEIDGGDAQPMQPAGDGWFAAETEAPPGTRYRFRLPDGLAVPDPASRRQSGDVHGWSVIDDPSAYPWQHGEWQNRPWNEAVIYELHVGAMGGFAGVTERLASLAELGVTAVELMPVADFPGGRNWGYDGVLPYAPDEAYGTPDELRALIDTAHGLGLMVLLDVVYNHFGPDGAYLHAYAKPFFNEGVHTPWGAAIDFRRPEVQDYFVDNALMWLNDYRFDGLRFDAVHAISPPEFLPELARRVREGARQPVHLILEHEGNRASLLRPEPGEGPLFDAQWADDFHHCLHVLLTGETEGYYESFAERPAEQLARALAEGFVFQGEISPHHGEPRGEPSAYLPPTAFVFCLQNHDQVGNRALGERLTLLAQPQALRAATTLLLMAPFIPMLFMGEEWGERRPFLFFTSHNEELAKLVREGRRREFAHFRAFADPETRERIPDPNAEETFTASFPEEAGGDLETLVLHRHLLALRRDHVIPGIPGCESVDAQAVGPAAVRAAWLLGTGRVLTIAANFGEAPVEVDQPDAALLFASREVRHEPGIVPPRCTLVFLDEEA